MLRRRFGSAEADPAANKLSNESPVGKAIMGRKKGETVEVGLGSLTVSCDAMRAGEQTINLTVDPDHASALIAKAKSAPGVVAAGWTSGSMEMDRTIRFSATGWRMSYLPRLALQRRWRSVCSRASIG